MRVPPRFDPRASYPTTSPAPAPADPCAGRRRRRGHAARRAPPGCSWSGSHDRALGQLPDGLVEAGQHRLPGGVTLGNQARPPPLGDLADPPVQSSQGHGGPAEPLIEPRDGPGPGLGQQPADPLGEPGAAPAGVGRLGASRPARSPRPGCSGGSSGTVAGSQPSSSAIAVGGQRWCDSKITTRRAPTRWVPYSAPNASQGQPAGRERLAYTLGGRILSAASSGRRCVEAPTTTRLLRALPPTPPALRARPPVVRLAPTPATARPEPRR